jgi:Peptidase inhibitor I78 family
MKSSLFLPLLLIACARPVAETPAPDLLDCDASRAQGLVGQKASETLGKEALKRTGSQTLRWTRPGQAVTMDYRTDRLNIDLDERDVVVRIGCG